MEEFKYFVRIATTDIKGEKSILYALQKIKGVSHAYAHAVCFLSKVPATKRAGDLSDDEVKKLEAIVSKPIEHGIPIWLLNRRNDPETGADLHLVSGNLPFVIQNDLKMMKKMKSYKGVRHMFGLPVRGQRTRSNFRRNKGKVMGVKRAKGKGAKK